MEGKKIMSNEIIDVVRVWTITAIANIVTFVGSDFIKLLPIIQNILGIISLLIAIFYTLYKFVVIWEGWNPRKKQNKK